MSRVSASVTAPVIPVREVRRAAIPFHGLIDPVIVEDPVLFTFDGAIGRDHAHAVWAWMRRDLGPDLLDDATHDGDRQEAAAALTVRLPDLLKRAQQSLAAAAASTESERRLRAKLGGEDGLQRLPQVLLALRSRALLERAQSFGRAVNGMDDEAQIAAALRAMPLADRPLTALLMHAAMGQVIDPAVLVSAAIRVAGANSEQALNRVGLGPLIDAILAHAQNQLPLLTQVGPFADIDLLCRALERFHRLARSVNALLDLGRNGRWAMVLGGLTRNVSDRVERRVRNIVPDLSRALRRQRDGVADRFDSDEILNAMGNLYLLATIREARDSLALNAMFEQTWNQVGQALEIHLERNLDSLRRDPADAITAQRLDAAIKMAEVRFGRDYAELMHRAREAAERRQPVPETGAVPDGCRTA